MGVYPELTAPDSPFPWALGGGGHGLAPGRSRGALVGAPGPLCCCITARRPRHCSPAGGTVLAWPSPHQAGYSRKGRPLVGRLGLAVTPGLCRTLTLPASDPSLDSAHAVAPARTLPQAGPGGRQQARRCPSRPPADTQGSPLPHTGALPARSSLGSGSHARAPIRIPGGAPPHSPPAPISALSQVGLVSAPKPHSGVDTRGGRRGARARNGDRRGTVLQHDGALRGHHPWGPGCHHARHGLPARLLIYSPLHPSTPHAHITSSRPLRAGALTLRLAPALEPGKRGSLWVPVHPLILSAHPEYCVAGAPHQVWGEGSFSVESGPLLEC